VAVAFREYHLHGKRMCYVGGTSALPEAFPTGDGGIHLGTGARGATDWPFGVVSKARCAGGPMHFKTLFQMPVLGRAVLGTSSACLPSAAAQSASPNNGSAPDGGEAADAGQPKAGAGGGAPGW
jgi:hypothetical protein